jgi:type II secretory pathway pseudopilin PulG
MAGTRIRTRLRKNAGLTLIEIMVSVFVFLMVFAVLTKTLQNIRQIQLKSHELSIASQIFAEVTEQIMYMRDTGGWNMIETGSLLFNGNNVHKLNELDNSNLNVNVQHYKDKNNVGVDTLKQVTVNLSWDSADGNNYSESCVTILSQPPGV